MTIAEERKRDMMREMLDSDDEDGEFDAGGSISQFPGRGARGTFSPNSSTISKVRGKPEGSIAGRSHGGMSASFAGSINKGGKRDKDDKGTTVGVKNKENLGHEPWEDKLQGLWQKRDYLEKQATHVGKVKQKERRAKKRAMRDAARSTQDDVTSVADTVLDGKSEMDVSVRYALTKSMITKRQWPDEAARERHKLERIKEAQKQKLEHVRMPEFEYHSQTYYILDRLNLQEWEKHEEVKFMELQIQQAIQTFEKDWKTLDRAKIEYLIRLALARTLTDIERRKDARIKGEKNRLKQEQELEADAFSVGISSPSKSFAGSPLRRPGTSMRNN